MVKLHSEVAIDAASHCQCPPMPTPLLILGAGFSISA